MEKRAYLEEKAKEIRQDTLRCIGSLGVGHIGGSLSIADVLAVLYFEKMNIDPKNPGMPSRDRFVLSKGHGGPAVYATWQTKDTSINPCY
jgi:transketolase